jgi:hypothetical protein
MSKAFQGKGLKILLNLVIGAIATCLTILFHPFSSSYAATQNTSGNAYTPLSIALIVVGIVVFVIYIKSMLTVLGEAASSYTEMEDDSDHISYYSSPAWGAALAGIIAAVVISLYGVSPLLLYIGPILCMLSPMAIIYCMSKDIQEFKKTHSSPSEVKEPFSQAVDS